jgi:hypothetical protein
VRAYDHRSEVEQAVVVRSRARCLEGLGSICQGVATNFYWGNVTHLFAGPSDLIPEQGGEVLLDRRICACRIVHKNLQCCKLAIIVRPVIAAKGRGRPHQVVSTVTRDVGHTRRRPKTGEGMRVTHLVVAASASASGLVVSHPIYDLDQATRPESIAFVHPGAFPARSTSTALTIFTMHLRSSTPAALPKLEVFGPRTI